jgi:hypothetical protein
MESAATLHAIGGKPPLKDACHLTISVAAKGGLATHRPRVRSHLRASTVFARLLALALVAPARPVMAKRVFATLV